MDGSRDRWARIATAAGLGALSMLAVEAVGSITGMVALLCVPGAGIAAAVVMPRWPGWVALVLGLAGGVALLEATAGHTGVWPLVIVVLSMLATGGWFAGLAAVRVQRLGLTAAVRDARFAGALAAMVGMAALFLWVMAELSSNPA